VPIWPGNIIAALISISRRLRVKTDAATFPTSPYPTLPYTTRNHARLTQPSGNKSWRRPMSLSNEDSFSTAACEPISHSRCYLGSRSGLSARPNEQTLVVLTCLQSGPYFPTLTSTGHDYAKQVATFPAHSVECGDYFLRNPFSYLRRRV